MKRRIIPARVRAESIEAREEMHPYSGPHTFCRDSKPFAGGWPILKEPMLCSSVNGRDGPRDPTNGHVTANSPWGRFYMPVQGVEARGANQLKTSISGTLLS